jgi:hypothetical protein
MHLLQKMLLLLIRPRLQQPMQLPPQILSL